jgi:ribose transport system ATP-binding protein
LKARALKMAEKVGLRFSSLAQPVESLSGGNQQKVLFGRAQWANPRLLIVDEPTRGVDIAAKRSIHADLEDAAAKGAGVLFISSELDEVAGVCTRILVMWRGMIVGEFFPPYDKASLVSALFGEVDGER